MSNTPEFQEIDARGARLIFPKRVSINGGIATAEWWLSWEKIAELIDPDGTKAMGERCDIAEKEARKYCEDWHSALDELRALRDQLRIAREAVEAAENFLVLFDVHGRTGKTPDGYHDAYLLLWKLVQDARAALEKMGGGGTK